MRTTLLLPLALLAIGATGCAASAPADTAGHRVRVLAAEDFWGSLAAQLAGPDAVVTSIITDPAQDPHDYEPTVADARAVSAARLVIVNGIGYDRWASQLLAASPAPGRLTLNVGSLLGRGEGENPHRWYSPADVELVAGRITAELARLDPAHAGVYDARRHALDHAALAPYHAAIAQIRRRYAGTAIGASESIMAMLTPALGLRLITPPGFMTAISEGNELSAADTIAAEHQIERRQITVWVYNAQNVTPAIQRLTALARGRGIPVVTITETLPRHTTFAQWQVGQLERLMTALHQATGR